eukprot:gene20678-27473_t
MKKLIGAQKGVHPLQVDFTAAHKLMGDTKVSTLIKEHKNRTVIVLKESATIEEALQILSCPVVTSGEKTGSGCLWPSDEVAGDLAGFLDIRDILNNFLKDLTMSELEGMNVLQKMRFLEDKGSAFASTSLNKLDMGVDGDFILAASEGTQSLTDFIRGLLNPAFSKEVCTSKSHVVHRVAVFDKKGRITAVVSQSDVVRFLDSHVNKLGPLAKATVQDLGWVTGKVESCTPESSAIQALAKMSAAKISSLAVVDSAGKMIGNFSMSEMRTIMAEQFGSLALPVGDFLALSNKTEYQHNRSEHTATTHATVTPVPAANRQADSHTGHAHLTPQTAHRPPNTGTAQRPPHNGHAKRPPQTASASRHRTPLHRTSADLTPATEQSANARRANRPDQHHRPTRTPATHTGHRTPHTGHRHTAHRPPHTAPPVLSMMAQKRIHRVYIMDSEGVPVGIITCTDLLRKLV